MDFQHLKHTLDQLVSEKGAPGVDCSVYQDHREIFRYHTGMKDAEENIPLSGNELYYIFSMTKMLTCVSALQLFEKGAFLMDDPLEKYMEEYSEMYVSLETPDTKDNVSIQTGQMPDQVLKRADGNMAVCKAKKTITIRHLFSMAAGLDYDLNSSSITNAIAAGKTTTVEIARALSGTVLRFEPGTGYNYSLCHDVLGALVELWSGMRLGDYMKENIFQPLGMKETFFTLPEDAGIRSRLATLYVRDKDCHYRRIPQRCEFNFTESYQSGGAGLISSTADYGLFLDALACGGVGKTGKRILSASSVELMRCNQLKDRQMETFERSRKGYGYGFGVRTHVAPERSGSPSPAGEFGWGGAAGAFSLVDPQNKLSLTYFQHMRRWTLNLEEILRNALYASMNDR